MANVGCDGVRRYGLTIIYDPPTAELDLFILHGLDGSPTKTFQWESNGFFWPKDLSRWLPKARIGLFGYNADISKGGGSLSGVQQHAESLLLHLRNHRLGQKSRRPIVLVGHSLGGLVIKQALILSSDRKCNCNITTSTRLIVFLGVPHRGSHLLETKRASIASELGRVVNYSVPPKIKAALQPEADETYIMNTQFMRIKNDISIMNFYESMPDGFPNIPGLGGIVVMRESAVFDSETSENMQVTRNHRDLVRFEGPEDDFYRMLCETLRRKIAEFMMAKNDVELYENSKRLREGLLKILKDPSFLSVSYHTWTPHSHTLQWLWVEGSDFAKWVTEGHGLFAVTGKPGSGKSVLMNAVNTHVRRHIDNPSSVVVSHFFNSRGNPTEKTFVGFLRSILFQLIRADIRFFQRLQPEWEILRKQIVGDDLEPSPIQDFPQHVFTVKILEEMILSAVLDMPTENKVLVLVDGLDECEDGSTSLRSIADFLNRIASSDGTRLIQICFSCRSLEPYSFNQLAGSFNLQERNRPDIVKFIDDHWQSMPSISNYDNEITSLKSSILSRADGVFLWVRLVLERIQKALATGATVSEIKAIIDTPNQLHGLFSTLISRIEPSFLSESRMMLSIILAAERPLSLREFRHVVVLNDRSFETQEELNGSSAFIQSDEIMKRRILSRCGGLVEIKTTGDMSRIDADIAENNSIQFIHQSVKEFLVQPQECSIGIPDMDALEIHGHKILSRACTNYLRQKDIWNLARRSDWSFDHRKVFNFHAKFFLRYAEENWSNHVRAVETSGTTDVDICSVNPFVTNRGHFETYIHLRNRLHPADTVGHDFDAVQLAVEANLPQSLRWLCNKGLVNMDFWHQSFGHYIHLAVWNDNAAVTRVLLENGARMEDKDITNETPLFMACYLGNLEIVTLLLEFGAEIVDSVSDSDDPLAAAISSGNEKVVEKILDHSGEIYAHPWHRSRAISILRSREADESLDYESQNQVDMQSKLSKWDRIFRIICQRLNFEDPIGLRIRLDPIATRTFEINESRIRPELDRMCCVGTVDSVRALLETLQSYKKSPDILDWIQTPSGPSYSTLLHWAALNTSPSVLSYLLELGLSPDSQDINGDTPLHLAVRQQKEPHIGVLIQYNANRKIKSTTGHAAFHDAILNMTPYASAHILIQLIVDSSDINLRDNNGMYPVHLAAYAGAYTALKWLLDKGANANVQDDFEMTPLHCASISRGVASIQILDYLISQGLDVTARGLAKVTPLHAVVGNCDIQRDVDDIDIAFAKVELLLKNGADANAQDLQGNTPLHLTSWKDHKGIVRLLLRAGAQTSITDNRGLTAMEMTQDDEIREMMEMTRLGT
ncbi:hypothetical protein F5B19DRAFT_477271 [Rostrohypoxylon terebratum]|nr:hypothetical protein F5B19DRAFT_477271 [Rostrohypoxylon terebratum]